MLSQRTILSRYLESQPQPLLSQRTEGRLDATRGLSTTRAVTCNTSRVTFTSGSQQKFRGQRAEIQACFALPGVAPVFSVREFLRLDRVSTHAPKKLVDFSAPCGLSMTHMPTSQLSFKEKWPKSLRGRCLNREGTTFQVILILKLTVKVSATYT